MNEFLAAAPGLLLDVQVLLFKLGVFMVGKGQKLVAAVQKLRQIVQQLQGHETGERGVTYALREMVATSWVCSWLAKARSWWLLCRS
jgi:hypothetical protein